ncbi:pre-mRNA-splicing factor CWC25 homolog [Punica granatum]|uniref:Uncharacterized protein n=2 Tax=Punica granatum TaxID=22663 RepID=A0A2I0IU80_PUNGR|nr:pre-mRNA-splicing factor CWC25 homolog [Punica granatum]PKI47552.1 hypothetical protein CRG98_032046 [Punica granatum]
MALKFLNKKGWHTGSLRNIENVWKAEQKHEEEQKKLEELRKQIQEERERNEFRLLQEQAGIVPRQERLDFLYDSGLAVGKGSSEGVLFKSLDKGDALSEAAASSSSAQQASASGVPGALFEDKSNSANDAWRKLHSDPLLLIRKREQEALARIKNNPVQMAMIRKSAGEKEDKDDGKKERRKKHHHKDSKHKKHVSSEPADSSNASDEAEKESRKKSRKSSNRDEYRRRARSDSEDESSDTEIRRRKSRHEYIRNKETSVDGLTDRRSGRDDNQDRRNHEKTQRERYYSEGPSNSDVSRRERERKYFHEESASKYGSRTDSRNDSSNYKRRNVAPKISEEERAARLQEMQMDAELHEEQRWKRLKKADDNDASEANRDVSSRGKNFLDAIQKSVYGAEKGGSSTIEESVRRRTYYSQHRSQTGEGNAFRRS